MFPLRVVSRPIVLAALIALVGCAGAPSGPGMPEDPAAAMAALESRLLDAPAVRFETVAVAEGVVTADLAGFASWSDTTVDVEARGTFVERPADLHLALANGKLTGGNGDYRFESDVPPALREALALGTTRMGILHNLARLAGATPPDHSDGGVGDWLTTAALRWGAGSEVDGRSARPLEFTVVVDGAPVAEARLWLRTADGLPVRREQTVKFPQGDMTVVETYRDWNVDTGP